MIPDELDGSVERLLASLARGMLPSDFQPRRAGHLIGLWAFGFTGKRRVQLERPPRQVNEMTPHVAEDTVAKVPTPIPVQVSAFPVTLIVGAFTCWTEPAVPVEPLRNFLCRQDGIADRIDTATTPDVSLGYGTNSPRLDQLPHASKVVSGMDLGAHLGGDLVLLALFGVGIPHLAGLKHIVGERFLTVDVQALLHRSK